MDFEFDKEIDSLLRRTAKGESVRTTFDAHPDADEISLFAENALTTKARARTVGHLAECAKCRKILSNLISFNAESESETIHAAEESDMLPAAAASTPAIPWYRRAFAFPQITFAMGALVLVFSGIIAFLVLQTASDGERGSSTIAQREEIRETQKGVSGADSDGETRTVETYSSSNSANAASVNPNLLSTSNTTTANSTTNSTSVNTGSTAGNVTSPVTRAQPQVERNEPVTSAKQENTLMSANDSQDTLTPAPQNKPSISAGAPLPTDAAKQQRENEAAKESSERSRIARESGNESQQVTVTGSSPSPRLAEKKSAAVKNKSGEVRAVGGKTFRNVGGIWFDAAYASQPQIMIRRGSEDYKRLDSGLRSIAENLGGTIVVLWKGRAYRIY